MHVVVVPEQVEQVSSHGSHAYTPPSKLSKNPLWQMQDSLTKSELVGHWHDPSTKLILEAAQVVQVIEVPEQVRQSLWHWTHVYGDPDG